MERTLGDLLTTFKTSAFRLEALTSYNVPEDAAALRQYGAGAAAPPPGFMSDWQDLVRSASAKGRTMSRVHVVPQSLTPYLKFEVEWGYPGSVEAGEDVRILQTDRPANAFKSNWPASDFWLFDDETVALMNYDADGSFVGATITTDPAVLARSRAIRDIAMSKSVDLGTFQEISQRAADAAHIH